MSWSHYGWAWVHDKAKWTWNYKHLRTLRWRAEIRGKILVPCRNITSCGNIHNTGKALPRLAWIFFSISYRVQKGNKPSKQGLSYAFLCCFVASISWPYNWVALRKILSNFYFASISGYFDQQSLSLWYVSSKIYAFIWSLVYLSKCLRAIITQSTNFMVTKWTFRIIPYATVWGSFNGLSTKHLVEVSQHSLLSLRQLHWKNT